jgi:deoxycytidylate deaminase
MFTRRDYRYFELAKEAAITSTHPKAKIGAVAVDGKNILAVGVNQSRKSHPRQKHYNMSRNMKNESICEHNMHAEFITLLKAAKQCKDLSNVKLYINRVMKDNKSPGNCRPCAACAAVFKFYKVRKIYYATERGLVYEEFML